MRRLHEVGDSSGDSAEVVGSKPGSGETFSGFAGNPNSPTMTGLP